MLVPPPPPPSTKEITSLLLDSEALKLPDGVTAILNPSLDDLVDELNIPVGSLMCMIPTNPPLKVIIEGVIRKYHEEEHEGNKLIVIDRFDLIAFNFYQATPEENKLIEEIGNEGVENERT